MSSAITSKVGPQFPPATLHTGGMIFLQDMESGFTPAEVARAAAASFCLLDAARVMIDPSAPNTPADFARLREAVAVFEDLLAFAVERQRQIDAGEWPRVTPATHAVASAAAIGQVEQVSTLERMRAGLARAARRIFGRG